MADLPDYLRSSQAPRMAESLSANLGVGSPPFISIQGNQFKLVDAVGMEQRVTTADPQIGPYLDCVLIDKNDHISKIWWGRPFTPGEEKGPPDCWSDNGVAPSVSASSPQSPTCASCPNNVWGSEVSKISGRGVKACKDFQKLAALVPGHDMIFLLRVPPNSLRNLRDYTHKFNNQNFDVKDVLTRISFQAGVLGTLQFHALKVIDKDLAEQREEAYAEKATITLVGKTDQPRTAVLPAPSAPMTGTGNVPIGAIAHSPQVQPMQSFTGGGAAAHTVQSFTGGAATQPAANAPPTEEPRRRRRTKAEIEAARAGNGPDPTPAAAPFGIGAGTEPLPDLKQGLDAIFGKK